MRPLKTPKQHPALKQSRKVKQKLPKQPSSEKSGFEKRRNPIENVS